MSLLPQDLYLLPVSIGPEDDTDDDGDDYPWPDDDGSGQCTPGGAA